MNINCRQKTVDYWWKSADLRFSIKDSQTQAYRIKTQSTFVVYIVYSCWGLHTASIIVWYGARLECGHLVGQVVKASASWAEDPEFDSRLRHGDFSGPSHTSDLKIGTQVATLPCAWRYRVSSGTGWPGVSIMGLGEVESLICNF